MQVEVKKLDPVRRELKFKVSKERVSKTLEEVYKDLSKKAKVKGFRQGKVPRNVLEAQYSHTAQHEVMNKIIPEVYQEAIEQEKLAPMDMPEIQDVDYKDGEVTFTAKLDIKPEFEVKDYKKIKVNRKSSEVTDEDINKTLEYFKQGQGKEKEVPIDDAFANGLGYPNLEEFKKSLSRQIEIDKDRQNRADVENQIFEVLLKKTKLTVPQSLVKKQLERRVEDSKKRMKSQGISDEEIQKKDEEMRKELKGMVEKDLTIFLILEKIASMENIEVKEGENLPAKVVEFLLKEAEWT